MAKVYHYIPSVNSKFICSKGGPHAQEPLTMVCLDPLCQNDPLGCAVCFIHIHKHHRVVSVDKFVDQYNRNVRVSKGGHAMKKIAKEQQTVKTLIKTLREEVNKQLDHFEESINQYADELRRKTHTREYLSKSLGIPLEPSKVRQSRNNQQFTDFLRFILNNSLFDSSNNMIQIVDILKQDEDRIYALLDKMVNMTSHCQEYIKDVMKSLGFSDETVKIEKIIYKEQLEKMNINQDQFVCQAYNQREIINKTIHQTMDLAQSHQYKSLSATNYALNKEVKKLQGIKYTFSTKNKHELIEIKSNYTVGLSNITALKPQYAFLTPHLNNLPSQVKEWTLKINKCRNFASQNTMGIGIATLDDVKNGKFEGQYPKKATILTSQGYVIENGSSRKTNFIFGAGDVLYCSYDPFYKQFEISKQNGRKLTLTIDRPDKEELFVCVRLTYASDQVQIL